MHRDPAVVIAVTVLMLAMAVAVWLLSGTWLVHGSIHSNASVGAGTAITEARQWAALFR